MWIMKITQATVHTICNYVNDIEKDRLYILVKTGGIICKIYSLSTHNFNLIHSAMIPFLLSLSTLHVQSKLPKRIILWNEHCKDPAKQKQYKQGSFHPISWWYAPLRSVNCCRGLCEVVVLTAHGKTAEILTTFFQTTVLITLTIVLSRGIFTVGM